MSSKKRPENSPAEQKLKTVQEYDSLPDEAAQGRFQRERGLYSVDVERWLSRRSNKKPMISGGQRGRQVSAEDRQTAVKLVTEAVTNGARRVPACRGRPPLQFVPTLADRGIYVFSESSFYRILRHETLLTHRGKSAQRRYHRPQTYRATAVNQVWS